jgi:hypothetical protein
MVLTDLLRKPIDGLARMVKDRASIITLDAREAVRLLKEKFREIVKLNHFLEDLVSRIEIDASRGGLGRVLS